MGETRKTRAQLTQASRERTEAARERTRNTGAGISFLNAKHSSGTGRLKK